MTAYQFFKKHAGFSYGTGETPEQGRRRCARELAAAERAAADAGVEFLWEQDDTTNEEWEGAEGAPFYYTWVCIARVDGETFASCGGIDFGRDREPWGDPYKRVMEAQLACELPVRR